MVRVSQHYQLQVEQHSLEFVDVHVDADLPVFIDPRALRTLESDWANEAVHLLQDFFEVVIQRIRAGDTQGARHLLSTLREPNETRLGYSRGRPRGRALGDASSLDIADALAQSEAARTGLLEDLEDSILMVRGIGPDIVSDMTTNVIRGLLIEFTQNACSYHGIPVSQQIAAGHTWNPVTHEWQAVHADLPIADGQRLLLVPKAIVRIRQSYSVEEYFRNYLVEALQEAELNANSELVQLLRDGRRRVTKKSVVEKYGSGKATIVEQTRAHPEALARYRDDQRQRRSTPLNHEQFAELTGAPEPDWDQLLRAVREIPAGLADADAYHRAVEALLSALFYPALEHPIREFPIHDGRKRIDIRYTNIALGGFFGWLGQHYPAPNVFVECKNYSGDIGNPGFDQLAGRFSPSRGRFGIVAYRAYDNKELYIERCKDTAADDRGFIVPIDDEDLALLVEERRQDGLEFSLFRNRFDALIM